VQAQAFQNPSVNPHVSQWLHSTPLPVSLFPAQHSSSAPSSFDADSTTRRKKKKERGGRERPGKDSRDGVGDLGEGRTCLIELKTEEDRRREAEIQNAPLGMFLYMCIRLMVLTVIFVYTYT
jgi:hypothetical protein